MVMSVRKIISTDDHQHHYDYHVDVEEDDDAMCPDMLKVAFIFYPH